MGEQRQDIALGAYGISLSANIGASQTDFFSAAMAVKGLICMHIHRICYHYTINIENDWCN